MIKGIGCDLVTVSRIEQLLCSPRFRRKVYTPYEQEIVTGCPACTAAGIWAAKEAVSKAFGTGFAGFQLRDIEVRRDEKGKPYVCLYGRALEFFDGINGETIHLSISHEKDTAMAFAIIE